MKKISDIFLISSLIICYVICGIFFYKYYSEYIFSQHFQQCHKVMAFLAAIGIQMARFAFALRGAFFYQNGKTEKAAQGFIFSFVITIYECFEVYNFENSNSALILVMTACLVISLIVEIQYSYGFMVELEMRRFNSRIKKVSESSNTSENKKLREKGKLLSIEIIDNLKSGIEINKEELMERYNVSNVYLNRKIREVKRM